MRQARKSTAGEKEQLAEKMIGEKTGAETREMAGGRRGALAITVRANGTATQREGGDS
jgi:hypothetical protein